MTIPELIQYLESYPHKVVTKQYILDRLRESQRHETGLSAQLEVEFENALRNVYRPPDDVRKGGDADKIRQG